MTELLVGTCASTKSAGVASVIVGSQTVPAQCPQGLTVAVGDVVAIGHLGSSYYILNNYFTSGSGNSDSGNSPEPPTAPSTTTGSTTFIAARKAVSTSPEMP